MRYRGAFLAMLLALSGAPALDLAWAGILVDQPYRIGWGDRITTDVFINNKGPFTFLLDTAASRSMMFEHVRAGLGLPVAGAQLITVYGMQNVGTAKPVRPEDLRLSNHVIHGLTMGVLPDDRDGSDGLLGMDVLGDYLVVMDRPGLRLQLLTPDSGDSGSFRRWPSLDLTPRPMMNSGVNFWSMRASINGHPVVSLLDMGSGVTMLNWAAAEQLGLRRTNYAQGGLPQELRDALGLTGPVVVATGLNIWVAEHLFRDQTVIVANARVFDYFGFGDRPAAIMGAGLLKDNSLAIDFAGHRMFVGPGPGDTLVR